MRDKDLSKNNYIGVVVSNEDETCSGRCKIRVFGLMDELDDNLLPWFSPMTITTFSSQYGGGNFSVPKVGTYVRVQFANNDILSGEYACVQNLDPNLKDLIKNDYIGTHVILYDCDQELIIVFQPNSGLTILYKDTKFNISPTNMITLSEPNNNAIITLDNDTINITTKGEINITSSSAVNVTTDVANIEANSVNVGKNASVPAVNGTALMEVLTEMAKAISDKYPITFGMPNPNSFNKILSSSVKISK